MRIVALIAAFNEERFIRNALQHLADQGVETYVIDNESTDATRDIVESFRGSGVAGVETFARHGVFAAGAILRRKEQLHLELAADWYIHYDADTILQAPNPYGTLAEGIAAVDRAGDNAINFDEFLFVPTGPQDDHDNDRYIEEMRRYVYMDVQPLFRINAWKNLGQRIRLADGGHRVVFDGRRVHAESFIMRHYMVLSSAHLARKYGQRRYPRAELLRGWHGRHATVRPGNIGYPDPMDLRELSIDNTWDRSAPVRSSPVLANAPEPMRLRRAVVRRLVAPGRVLERVARRIQGMRPGSWRWRP